MSIAGHQHHGVLDHRMGAEVIEYDELPLPRQVCGIRTQQLFDGFGTAILEATRSRPDQQSTSTSTAVADTGRDPADRKPLLLVPGMLCDANLWSEVVIRLKGPVRLQLAPSPLGDSITEMAEMLLRTAPQRFALAGHSLGGIVALEVVRRAPKRVTRIALLNTSAREPTEIQQAQWDNWRAEVERGEFTRIAGRLPDLLLPVHRRGDEELRLRLTQMALAVGGRALLRQLAAQRTRPDGRPSLSRIACPAIVIAGEADEVCPQGAAQELAAGISGASLEWIAGCGHMAPLEQPQAVAELLSGWFQ